jgi:N-acetylmuramoyl-L-alanine amidase
MKRKIYLIAGHSNSDPGAVSTVKEADLTKELRNLVRFNLERFMPSLEIVTDNDSDSLSEVIKEVNRTITERDILIDIHFNSFTNQKATGAEVLVKNDSGAKITENAKKLALLISVTLGIANRGVKTEKDSARKKIGILHGSGDRYLIEVAFISNPEELIKYQINKHILASAITEEFEQWLKS